MSELEDTIFWPSGLNCADHTQPLWPSSVCSHSPVIALQIRTVLSELADTILWLGEHSRRNVAWSSPRT